MLFKSIKSIFESTELILLIAIVLPLLMAVNVIFIKSWIEICLGIVMFLSIRPFFKQKSEINEAHKNFKGIVVSLLLNYVILSGAYLFLASFFFPTTSEYFIGYILLAIIPPAVSIVPLCYLTKCNIKVADTALVIGYLSALVIIPLTMYLVFGSNINLMLLLRSLLILILIPMFLAYITRNKNNSVFNYTKIITNILIGVVVFIVISLNRATFLNIRESNVMNVFIINILVIFILGLIVYFVSRKFVSELDAIDYSLYATQKNEATGLAIALAFFSSNTAVPLIVALVMQFSYFIIFERFIISKTGTINNTENNIDNTNSKSSTTIQLASEVIVPITATTVTSSTTSDNKE